MKQHLLFVIDTLNIGGAERSLVTFLSVLDYSRYEIDVQLLSYGGALENYLPKEAHLLPPLPFTLQAKKPLRKILIEGNITQYLRRICYSYSIRKKHIKYTDLARLYWKNFSRYFKNTEQYDVAVAYAQELPTLYVADKVQAKLKFAWINISYSPKSVNYYFYETCYSKFDHIVTVSPSAHETFVQTYPQFLNKTIVIRDMYDGKVIGRMAEEECDIKLATDVPTLLTMARLIRDQKGFDISLEACSLLKKRGLRFRWYVLGRGAYRTEMERYITEHQLQDTFILLGAMANPYPVLRQCTLYVQTSRYEGFGLSIAEARILNKPVVTTEFEAVYAQMVQGENGLVVPQDPVAVADAIERLLLDAALYQHIVSYQQQEQKSNTKEIEKFYQMINLL